MFPLPAPALESSDPCFGPLDEDPPCLPRSSSNRHQQDDCGGKIYTVYLGYCQRSGSAVGVLAYDPEPVYAGITKQRFDSRVNQHAQNARCFTSHRGRVVSVTGSQKVHKIIARGMEQALIEHWGFSGKGVSTTYPDKTIDTKKKMPVGSNGRRKRGTLENSNHGIQPKFSWYIGAVTLGQATLLRRGASFSYMAFPRYSFYWCDTCEPKGYGAKLLKQRLG